MNEMKMEKKDLISHSKFNQMNDSIPISQEF